MKITTTHGIGVIKAKGTVVTIMVGVGKKMIEREYELSETFADEIAQANADRQKAGNKRATPVLLGINVHAEPKKGGDEAEFDVQF